MKWTYQDKLDAKFAQVEEKAEENQGTTCQECGRACVLVSGREIYPHYKDGYHLKYWQCFGCGAYVGCHGNSSVPLGTAAGPKLRQARQQAHRFFDYLWQAKMKADGCTIRKARRAGYDWLSVQLGIELDKCHMAQMSYEQCKQVVKVCTPYFRRAMAILEGKNDVELPKALPEQAPAPRPEASSNEAPHSQEDTQSILQPVHEAGSLGQSDNQGNAQDESASVVRRHAFWTKHITDSLHAVIVFLQAERIPCHFCQTPYLRRNLGISYDAHAPEAILACSRCMPQQYHCLRGVGRADDRGNNGTMRQLLAYKADHAEMHT